MIKYIMTSIHMDGEIEFQFDDAGMLIQLSFSSPLTEKQYEYLFKQHPYTLELMGHFIANTKNVSFTKETKEITFVDFWNKYGEKEHSSKKKAETHWNNMPKNKRIKAFNFINKYKYNLPQGVRMKYAETYLNSEIWEN